jgi:Flp pilus assembly protein TadG
VIRRRLHCERGSVLVLVAAAMFPALAVLTFAIDVSHWFDYSRNLQNRADAAALAGGQGLGVCIGSTGTAGN